jgi:hypothetical protein
MTCLFPIQAIGRHLKSFCQQPGKRCVMVKFLQLLVWEPECDRGNLPEGEIDGKGGMT